MCLELWPQRNNLKARYIEAAQLSSKQFALVNRAGLEQGFSTSDTVSSLPLQRHDEFTLWDGRIAKQTLLIITQELRNRIIITLKYYLGCICVPTWFPLSSVISISVYSTSGPVFTESTKIQRDRYTKFHFTICVALFKTRVTKCFTVTKQTIQTLAQMYVNQRHAIFFKE